MADALDVLRHDALQRRIKGLAGGHHIVWNTKDIALIRDQIMVMPEKILRAAPTAVRKFHPGAAIRRKTGVAVSQKMQSDDLNFLWTVSTAGIDLANDSIAPGGIDARDFVRNPAVLNAHDSLAAPIAISGAPWVSGDALMAVAKFPQPGISAASDQIAAAVRASLVRGASVGFIPLKWIFSKDPGRPLGIDFLETKLLEWSICSVPCNPDCIIVGAVSPGGKSARRNASIDDISEDEDKSDWQCHGACTMPIDSSDDAFDPIAAKAALLARCSASGTISDEARRYFLAVDVSTPLDPVSYGFPFCRVTEVAGVVASKIGWRQSVAALEKSDMPGTLLGDARALVDSLELRLGDVKTLLRRREAAGLVAEARSIVASTCANVPLTRDQRLAEARNFRRVAERT